MKQMKGKTHGRRVDDLTVDGRHSITLLVSISTKGIWVCHKQKPITIHSQHAIESLRHPSFMREVEYKRRR